MKCDKCGCVLDMKYYKSGMCRNNVWGSVTDIMIVWHLCPTNGIIRYNCLMCEKVISRERPDTHLTKCLHRDKILIDGVFIKMGRIRGEDKYFQVSIIFSKYPQLLVVNGLGINWFDSDNDADDCIEEIIAKKIATMNFHCMICGLNYETFPTENVLLTHLIGCVKERRNAKLN